MKRSARFFAICSLIAITSSGMPGVCAEQLSRNHTNGSYTKRVRKCVDLLMTHGTDTYGKVHAPMLVTILDIESRTCPEDPEKLDEQFRVTRRDRRSPGGSNLLTDQPTLKAMYALTDITGNKDYAAFAECI